MRGTWIEIDKLVIDALKVESSPMRGTWIEIIQLEALVNNKKGRPPCGGRGLKYR